ncbi:hypothetical protein Bca4012_052693 [Brassica carinata]
MGYEDFVYFILAEEDKSSVPSLEYCSFMRSRYMRWKECMEEEAVLFEDVLCQISDMIGPELTLVLLDAGCSYNISKRKHEREKPTLTEWDRFAHREYIRLSMNGSGEVRDELLEAPL